MIRKCLEIDAVPMLITRKIALPDIRCLSRASAFSPSRSHRQVFSPEVAHLLKPIQHTDLLGFEDVIALPPMPYMPLVKFLRKHSPRPPRPLSRHLGSPA